MSLSWSSETCLNNATSFSLFSFSLSWKLKGFWMESRNSFLSSCPCFLSISLSSIICSKRGWVTWLGTGRAQNFLWHSASSSSSLFICVVLGESIRTQCWDSVEALTAQRFWCSEDVFAGKDELKLSGSLCEESMSRVREGLKVELLITSFLEKKKVKVLKNTELNTFQLIKLLSWIWRKKIPGMVSVLGGIAEHFVFWQESVLMNPLLKVLSVLPLCLLQLLPEGS